MSLNSRVCSTRSHPARAVAAVAGVISRRDRVVAVVWLSEQTWVNPEVPTTSTARLVAV